MKYLPITAIAISALALAMVGVQVSKDPTIELPKIDLGSAIETNHATSTAASSVYGAFTSGKAIKSSQGVLSSVVITGANTGIMNFFDATTSDVNLRTGNRATSTILLASFPASTAAGEYSLESSFGHGLLLDLVSGNMPTTTINYR